MELNLNTFKIIHNSEQNLGLSDVTWHFLLNCEFLAFYKLLSLPARHILKAWQDASVRFVREVFLEPEP